MKYLKYGNTGTFVSVLGFGSMTFGEKNLWKLSGVNQELSDKMVKLCIDRGINLFDTADVYEAGDSEIMLGKSLNGYRDQVMIATKVRGRTGNGVNELGLSRHHMTIALRKSLERLGTTWVDIYQYHGWDIEGNVEEMINTMQSFVDQGKVLYPAVSNFAAWQIAYIQGLVEAKGYARYESAQMNYNIINRDVEYEVLPFLKYNKMTLLSWSPLHGGLLTGKYKKGEKPPKGTRMGDRGFFFPYFDEDHGWKIVEEIEKIADEQGCKPSQVALAWLIEKDVVVLLGARSMEQLEENLNSLDVKLKKEQIERLNKISEPRSMYPNWMIDRQNQDRRP
ncbi:MAG: aldo/keto reductase [Thermoplasmata archaeon]|nr:aldo/keto reductase [Thermoplasmata archaeon]